MENRKVFIGNLDFAVTEEELKTLLSDYGTVVHIKMQKKKGCAFIEMSSEAEAALAIEKLNGAMFMDREVRASLEMKVKEARALSIKKYNERAEGFSRRKKSENKHQASPNDTEHDAMETGPGEPSTHLEEIPAEEETIINVKAPRPAKKRPAAQQAVSPHPQRKEWRHDGPPRQERPSRDGRKSGHGRSPRPETNYNTRERWSDSDERPARNFSRGKSGSPHPRKKEWSPDKPSYSGRPSGPSRQPGAGNRNDSKTRPAGASSNRFSASPGPKPGSRGKNTSPKFPGPKARGGAEKKERGSRPKKD